LSVFNFIAAPPNAAIFAPIVYHICRAGATALPPCSPSFNPPVHTYAKPPPECAPGGG